MVKDKIQPTKLAVDANSHKGSVYSQVVGISVTDIDVTLEFVYVNPRDNTKGDVVARVTLPKTSGEDLANKILSTLKLHEENKGGKKSD